MENPSDGEQQDTKRREVIKEKVGKVRHVGLPEKRIHREDELFDPADINIKEVSAAICFASPLTFLFAGHCEHDHSVSSR